MKKKDTRRTGKLTIRKDTLRALTPLDATELAAAAGGRGQAPRTGWCTRGGGWNEPEETA